METVTWWHWVIVLFYRLFSTGASSLIGHQTKVWTGFGNLNKMGVQCLYLQSLLMDTHMSRRPSCKTETRSVSTSRGNETRTSPRTMTVTRRVEVLRVVLQGKEWIGSGRDGLLRVSDLTGSLLWTDRTEEWVWTPMEGLTVGSPREVPEITSPVSLPSWEICFLFTQYSIDTLRVIQCIRD